MKPLIPIERLREAIKYDPLTGDWTWLKPNPMALRVNPGDKAKTTSDSMGHLQISIDGRLYLVHRLAWYYMTGEWPKRDVDHKNRDKKNNRWSNLRKATRQKNTFNSSVRKNNKSGFKGVHQIPNGRYSARITISGKTIYLGYFQTIDAAHEAYVEAARKLHGEFFCEQTYRRP